MPEHNTRQLMSDSKFFESYSRWNDELNRYETWDEAVDRVMNMHRTFYQNKMSDELDAYMKKVETSYKNKTILGAQRVLQFGGDQILKHHMRLYNCTSSHADRCEFFGEYFYVLLCGAGVGFSVQQHHINKLPEIITRTKQPKIYTVEDSIEGWASSLDILMSSFFENGGKYPEYRGHRVYFDLSKIRPKGSKISGGFKAPGPDSLRLSLDRIEHILQGLVLHKKKEKLRPIHVYDICMHAADAVLSGGVRRSATLCLFSPDDTEMMKAKTGNWFIENPQRARSNNSALLIRNEVTKEQFHKLYENVKEFGEPGFIFAESKEHCYNPCVTGNTKLLTDKGYFEIKDLVGKNVMAWNGKQFSEVVPFSTGINPLMKVIFSNGTIINCTLYHKFILTNNIRVEAKDLKIGDKLEQFDMPMIENYEFSCINDVTVVSTEILNKSEETFCATEPLNNSLTFNGIVTGNCVEVGMLPKWEDVSGIQGCNLSEINGGQCFTEEKFYEACEAASIIGTLQAGYTDFKFLSPISKKIFDREALLGVSITGWMSNPKILFNEEILKNGASIVLKTNKIIAKLIGINPCARGTCVKPSGNASVLLQSPSGIHPEHSARYIRNVQMNKESEVTQLLKKQNPYMVEDSIWSTNKSDCVISFPIISNKDSLYKDDLYGVKHLEFIKKAQQIWVEYGTDIDLCVDKTLRHNVSNTITVKNWDEVEEYLFENREYFAGVALIPDTGDKIYYQAPYTKVLTYNEIIKEYKAGALFASGLIVDALKIYDNLWIAIQTAKGIGEDLSQEDNENSLKKDWNRRFEKFANNYFNNDLIKTEYCLKDIYLLHKWEKIQQNYAEINWIDELKEKKFVDIDTTGAAACSGVTENGESTCLL